VYNGKKDSGEQMILSKKITDTFYWAIMAALLFWFAYSKGWILANFSQIDAKQAMTLIEADDNLTILDVRSLEEFKEGHLPNAILIPVHELNNNLNKLDSSKNRKILVYCRSGSRSISASRTLESNGFVPINVKGGILDLTRAGAQLVK
jgi:rhodanese-related sulfurtransferase